VLPLAVLLVAVTRPPAAYVDTGAAHVPLAITSWCWDARCGAPLAANKRRATVGRGAKVRVELRFPALRAAVTVSGGHVQASTRGREVSWTATRGGGLTIFIRYARGWVIYAGRLVVR